MSLKASISGIRGVVGDSFTPDVILDFVKGFSEIIPEGKIIIGRDSRPTGKNIAKFVKSLLNSLGRDVIDVGIVPTPTVLFLVKNQRASGGIVITASHNPIQWNALKLVNSKGKFLSPDEFERLQTAVASGKTNYAKYDCIGDSFKSPKLADIHLDKVLNFVETGRIKKRKFKVVIDTVNGAGGPLGVKLLKKLGCKVIELNTDTSGYFSHPPEPTPENLKDLSAAVKSYKADIGFALDPDGDRLVVAGSDGVVLSEEYTLAICASHYLSARGRTDIVVNLSTSRLSADVAAKYGTNIVRVPTGEIHVTEKLEETGAKMGGEGNGGIIIPAVNTCRDAFVGMAFILEYMAVTGEKIEKIAADIGSYVLIKKKYDIDSIDLSIVADNIASNFKDVLIDTRDGIRIDFPDKWVLVRKSNTEPIVRIFAEAKDEATANDLIEKVKNIAGIK